MATRKWPVVEVRMAPEVRQTTMASVLHTSPTRRITALMLRKIMRKLYCSSMTSLGTWHSLELFDVIDVTSRVDNVIVAYDSDVVG